MSKFVHLHLHTEYSLLQSTCRISNLVEKAKQLGQPTLAITDSNNMYGAIDFYNNCKKNNIKPIIGCEINVKSSSVQNRYINNNYLSYKLILLCKNMIGYKNLIKLISKSYTESSYKSPSVDNEILSEYSEGLICISVYRRGEISNRIIDNDLDRAKRLALFYQKIYGENNFYIEIQNQDNIDDLNHISKLKSLSKDTKIPLVATNNVHYIEKQDFKFYNVLNCIKNNTKLCDVKNNEINFNSNNYLKSEIEMSELFKNIPSAVANTVTIAENCNLELEFGKLKLPEFYQDNISTLSNSEYLINIAYEGLSNRYGINPDKKIVYRLERELNVIINMGYTDYFLIVQDFIRFAKENKIPVGPGRGSGAGSIVAYSIGITEIDPVKYKLIFERFLNSERVSMPDFDIDFCYNGRQKVIDYVINKYGHDKVSQIITFGKMAAKAVIRDVGRALDLKYSTVDSIAKMIPNSLNITIRQALESTGKFKNLYENNSQIKNLVDISLELEGLPRHCSTHAAGIVITKDAIDNYVPLSKNDETIVTQYAMSALEQIGLLKMDFLGLRNLTIIDECVQYINSNLDLTFDIDKIDILDSKTYNMLSAGDSDGVFQMESYGVKQILKRIKPTSIEDLTAIISLHRPGPIETGSVDNYIGNKNKSKDVKYLSKKLKNILDVTYGCIVYQEQVMQIFRDLAGYSYGRSDIVRKAMSKKQHEIMQQERKNFIFGLKDDSGKIIIEGAIANGLSEEFANKLFSDMSKFAAYAFNKSHAVSYATIAYKTAYLKCHYEKEYSAAYLSNMDNMSKIRYYIQSCLKNNIKIFSPNINTSHWNFVPTSLGIEFGLKLIKGIGFSNVKHIVLEREKNGPYKSFYDFCKRVDRKYVKKIAIDRLVKSGAFDCLFENRKEIIVNLDTILKNIYSQLDVVQSGQLNMFENLDQSYQNKIDFEILKIDDYSIEEKIQLDKELIGFELLNQLNSKNSNFNLSSLNSKLYIKFDDIYSPDNQKNFHCITEIIKNNKGDTQMYLFFKKQNKIKILPEKYNVNVTDSIIKQIQDIIGINNVKFTDNIIKK